MKLNPNSSCPECGGALFQNMHNIDCFTQLVKDQPARDRLIGAAQNWLLSPESDSAANERVTIAAQTIVWEPNTPKP